MQDTARTGTRRVVPGALTAVVLCLLVACGGSGEARYVSAPRPTTAGGDGRTVAVPSTTPPTTVPAPTVVAATPSELLAATAPAVVMVHTDGCRRRSTGTAWLAPDGRLVTARHVVDGFRAVTVSSTPDGAGVPVTGVQVSGLTDLALLEGDWSPLGLRPLPLRTDRLADGEALAVVGFPAGEGPAITTGTAVNYSPVVGGGPFPLLRTTAEVLPGSSGGPALDAAGRVVGVVTLLDELGRIGLAVPADLVARHPASDLSRLLPCA